MVRLLAQRGYVRTDSRTTAILAALSNRGIFRGGGVFVGSHAYGALLNELGVRAAAFFTEDVDVARNEPLAVEPDADFEKILAESRVPLVPVPSFERSASSTSHKTAGPDRLRVDLLAPARGTAVTTRPVPELRTHAAALPYLGYLLNGTIDTVVLGRENVVPVRVPRPELFPWHKMLVSQLRTSTSEKRSKDVLQASVIFAVLAEDAPEDLAAAFAALPRTAKGKARTAAALVLKRLEASGHERGVDRMREIL